MKIYYSSEYADKQKPKLLAQTVLIVIFYYLLVELSKSVFFIFFAVYLLSCALRVLCLYKYYQKLPVAEYDENGIIVLFGYKLAIPAAKIKSIEYSQHKMSFILQNGRRAGGLLREMIPHDDFDRLVDFFKARFPHERIA